VYEKATVRRVDEGLGLAIDLQAAVNPPVGAKGSEAGDAVYRSYAHISNISDTQKIDDLAKRFKPGQVVKCRVVGFRQLDGLANVSLKPTVVDGSMLDISELRAGVKLSGVVDSIDASAMTVKLSPHLKAVVPALHMSDATHKKAHKKFKVGQTVSGAVLEVQPEKRKILMTMKKSLVDSKYPIIGSLSDVSAGMKSHGVVTGIRDDGIFVTFYNSMSGMIGESQLGLKSSQSPHDAFSVGQIVKARVLGANIKTRKLRLTLLTKQQAADVAARSDKLGGLAVGEQVRGVVKQVLKRNGHAPPRDEKDDTSENSEGGEEGEEEVVGYIVQLDTSAKNASSETFGRLDVGHLADHPSACSALADILEVGAVLEDLVVLEKLETVQQVRLTNKDSIRRHITSGEMPMRLEDVHVGSVLPGFVASVAGDAVYVRFVDHLTGRARLQQLSDSPVADPSAMFQLNMSVRACISHVDLEKGQISVSLKESVCSETGGMYVRSLFQDLELAGRLDSDTSVDWATAFRPFGSKVDVTVHSVKEYGILCDFKKYPDVVGLVAEGQFTESQSEKLTEGAKVAVTILDVSRKDGIVDLSALDQVRSALKRKSKGVDGVTDGEVVVVTVLQVKADDGYAIVALPENKKPPVGFVCLADFNQRTIRECTIHAEPNW
jgi:rRNA biogenesis protein RRP5